MSASGLQHPCTGTITSSREQGLGFLLDSLLPHHDAPSTLWLVYLRLKHFNCDTRLCLMDLAPAFSV